MSEPTSAVPDMEAPPTLFYAQFRAQAACRPDNVALEIQLRDGVESYTYGQLREMAESAGRWLQERRLEKGARIAILADNHPRWVAAYLGAIASGCTAVPLDTAFHADQVAKLLKDSGSTLLFCDTKHLETATQAITGSSVSLVLMDNTESSAQVFPAQVVGNLDAIFGAGRGDFQPAPVAPDDLAALLYTSGTTADPKGVMLTHGNITGEATGVFRVLRIGPSDAVLGILPLFHALAQMANLYLPLVAGARIVYLESLNTMELLRALSERNITVFAVVPQFFYLIHERIFKEIAKRGSLAQFGLRRLMAGNRMLRRIGINVGRLFFRPIHATFGPKMRYLITGGSRFDPQIGRDFYALGIDILQAYGLTETTGDAFLTPPSDNVMGSVGKPLPGVEGRIEDPQAQEDGGPAIGEILICGSVVMKGYWNRADATASVLKDGWLFTGDLGYFDEAGNLVVTGRKKEVIVLANGKNVYPEEIETHYQKSPFIQEICVMGLEARAGDPTSERLYGVIVPNFTVLKERKIVNTNEVIRFDIENLSTQLPSTKRLGSYEIWQNELPRTTTRKLKRFEIEKKVRVIQGKGGSPAEISQARLSSEDEVWLQQADVQRALKVVRDSARNKVQKLGPNENLELDLGLDSMQRIELVVALEREFGADVDESRVAELYTVRDLVDAVRSAARGGSGTSAVQTAGWKAILAEPPTDPEVLALARPRRFAELAWFAISRVLGVFANDRFHLQVTGLEKLPPRGPYIISSNHQSFIDPVVLGSVLPWAVFHDVFSVGTSEIFGSGFMRRLARWLRVIVVDPDANLVPAMRASAYGLSRGRILMLYPEGERSIDGAPKVFKKGAAILSIHLQVPIVPVAIEGFHEVWPRGMKFQGFFPLKIEIGDPLLPPPESAASEKAYEQLTAELRTRMVKMWSELRGSRGLKQANAAG